MALSQRNVKSRRKYINFEAPVDEAPLSLAQQHSQLFIQVLGRRTLARKISCLPFRTKSKEHSIIPVLSHESAVAEQSKPSLEKDTASEILRPISSLNSSPKKTAQTPPELSQGLSLPTQDFTNSFCPSTMADINPTASSAPAPIAYSLLEEITNHACSSALSNATSYHHPSTNEWNTTIISTILAALIKESTPAAQPSSTADGASSSSTQQPAYKFIVNSTIIQHSPPSAAAAASEPSSESSDPPTTTTLSAAKARPSTAGKRGMHSASGAYWNNEKDGMWSFKYEAADSKGLDLDIVVTILWVWTG